LLWWQPPFEVRPASYALSPQVRHLSSYASEHWQRLAIFLASDI
jgi:hypothetical protein